MRARRAIVVGVVLCVAAGCASILGIDDGKPYPPDGSADGSVDGADMDAFLDAMMMKEAAPVPDVNVEANSATCDFTRLLDSMGVFLSPTGSDNPNCTEQQPCRSINTNNLKLAVMRDKPIYLLAGDYPYTIDLEPLNLNNVSITIEGGWALDGGKWDPVCDFNVATVHGKRAVGGTGTTAAYAPPGSSLTLRLLTLQADPTTGGSSYGLFANKTVEVKLEAVRIIAGSGLPGSDGTPGNGTGPPNCAVGNMAMGANGGSGGSADGVYTELGYQPGMAGPGAPGEAGAGGGAGGPGGTGNCKVCDAGFGPGMGINSDAMSVMPVCGDTLVQTPGNPGGPGCGGGGGNGGNGGQTATASIAVYATGSGTLVLKSGTKLITQVGAAGGSGGAGAAGAFGSAGPPGSPSVPQYICMSGMCQSDPCAVEGGVGGSAGGTGGSGGRGGGGAGGPSVTIVRQNTVKVLDGSVQLGFNAGGDGGAPNGPPGDQQPEITF